MLILALVGALVGTWGLLALSKRRNQTLSELDLLIKSLDPTDPTGWPRVVLAEQVVRDLRRIRGRM